MGTHRRRAAARLRPPRLSVVLPVYDEPETAGIVVDGISASLAELPGGYEILVVDDGSGERTSAELRAARARHPEHVRVLRHPYNKGNGAAIKTGIKAARGESIAVLDADGQHRPADLLALLPFAGEYDLVVGARVGFRGTWYRALANRVFNALATWLTRHPIEDLTSGFRIFRADVVRRYVHMFPNGFSTSTTSTLAFLRGGHNVVFVPVEARPRENGHSSISLFADGWRFLLIIVKIVVIFSPMRVFLPVAGGVAAAGLVSAALASVGARSLVVPGTSAWLLVVAGLVVMLGLVSEQISALEFAVGELRR